MPRGWNVLKWPPEHENKVGPEGVDEKGNREHHGNSNTDGARDDCGISVKVVEKKVATACSQLGAEYHVPEYAQQEVYSERASDGAAAHLVHPSIQGVLKLHKNRKEIWMARKRKQDDRHARQDPLGVK